MAYIGQTSNLKKRIRTHQRKPPRRMRHDVARFTPWRRYFRVHVLKMRQAGALADREEARLIKLHNTLWPAGYNTLQGAPGRDPRLYAMLHNKHRTAKS